MDRRLSLHALMSITVSTLLPGSAIAASRQGTSNELAEPVQQEITADPLYAQAVALVMVHQKASISLVQRHLKLGYDHAARLLISMEQAGLIGSRYVNGYRQILTRSSIREG